MSISERKPTPSPERDPIQAAADRLDHATGGTTPLPAVPLQAHIAAAVAARSGTMVLKVFFHDNGISLLTQRFLPAMDRLGERCLLYIDPRMTIFVIGPPEIYSQDRVTGEDRSQYVAQIKSSLLFQEHSSFQGSVAFTISHLDLHKALRKLTVQSPDGVIQMELHSCKDGEGYSLVLTRKIEILPDVVERLRVHRLLSTWEHQSLHFCLKVSMPQRSVKTPNMGTLLNMLQALRNASDVVNVVITKPGDLYLNCGDHDKDNITAEFRRRTGDHEKGPLHRDVFARLRQACSSIDTYGVRVSTRMLLQSLDSYLTMPDHTILGTAGQELILAHSYYIPGTCELSDSMCFYCMIPSCGDGDYWRCATQPEEKYVVSYHSLANKRHKNLSPIHEGVFL